MVHPCDRCKETWASGFASCWSCGSTLAKPFAYDPSKSLDADTNGVEKRPGGIEVRNVSFQGPGEERLLAEYHAQDTAG